MSRFDRLSVRQLPTCFMGGCIALGFIVSIAPLHAGPAPISLASAMQDSAADAPLLRARHARVAAAREDAARASQLPDPVLMMGIDNLTITGADALHVGADLMTMRRVGISQSWPSRRKRDARQDLANAQLDTTISESQLVRLEVERRAGAAWLDTWAAEAERDFLLELGGEAERAARLARAQLANGARDSGAALVAEVALADLVTEQRRAEAQVQAARASLQRWLPDAGSTPLASAPDFSVLRVSPSMLRDSLERHAALQWWDERERQAHTAVNLARAEKRPDLGFGLSYGARSGRDDMMMFEVSVGLPLFTANRQDRDIAARIAERDSVGAEREDALRVQRELLERQLAEWSGLGDELDQFERVVLPLARDRTAVALASYRSGGSIQAWIDASRDEILTRRRHLETRVAHGRAWLLLDTLLPRETLHAQVQP